MHRRALLLAFTLGVVPLAVALPAERPAAASVSVLITLDELVNSSTYVVIATAIDHNSVWEELAGGRRIVTYTRLKVERAVVGAPGEELWVRTLGGVVGKIGQAVQGDAQIAVGSRALLFLGKMDSALVVTGMAQGHFPLLDDGAGGQKLGPSPDGGALLPRPGPSISAREVLLGAPVESAVLATQRARRSDHGKK